MKEQKKEAIVWDKKKIIIFLAVLFLLLFGAYELKSIILGQDNKPESFSLSKTDVKGKDTQNLQLQGSNIKQNIQNEINNLKTEAQNINIVDIASSSPQVQKVINDLKALQNYPSSQIKDACEKVCSGL